MKTNILNTIESYIERSFLETEEKYIYFYIKKAIDLLQNNRDLINDELTFNYLLGYCWYLNPYDSSKRSVIIKTSFNEALKLEPNHQFSILYLTHFYYDSSNYKEVLEIADKIDFEYFRSIDQKWRVLKFKELCLCSKIYLNHSDITESFKSLISLFKSVDKEDWPIPKELIGTINDESIYFSNKKEIGLLLKELIQLIEYKPVVRSL